jgi:hypothetical protein
MATESLPLPGQFGIDGKALACGAIAVLIITNSSGNMPIKNLMPLLSNPSRYYHHYPSAHHSLG